jgi:dihydrofolate reductase
VARLIYTSLASLDGYIADANGNFDWAEPDDAVHAFVNDLDRSVGTYLLGRRMYEVLAVWDTIQDERPPIAEYAEIWRSADKSCTPRVSSLSRRPRRDWSERSIPTPSRR